MSRIILPSTVHVASQVLPAGGATLYPDFQNVEYPNNPKVVIDLLSFIVQYTGASATGRPQVAVQWRADGIEPYDVRLDNFVYSSPKVSSDLGVDSPKLPPPGAGQTINLVISVENPSAMTEVRLIVAEVGDVANPGTIEVVVQGSGD